MKNRNLIVIIGSLLFVLANSYAITREFFYLPLLSAVAVVIYLMIWHVDWLMYLTSGQRSGHFCQDLKGVSADE